jgi:hypothetical protein
MRIKARMGEAIARVSAVEPLAFDLDGAVMMLGGAVSKELLRLEIKRGKLNSTRVGKRIVVERVELQRYLEANREQA